MKKPNSLNYIESKLDHVIETMGDFVTKEARIELFNVFNKLANYVLSTEYGLGPEISAEIAVSYSVALVDKVVTQKWKNVSGPDFTNFMRVDLEKHLKVPFGQAEMALLNSLEKHNLMPDETLLNYEIFCEINDILLQFFDINEIKRYLPLFLVTVSGSKLNKIPNLRDENFKYFSMLLISLVRKVSRFYVNDSCYLNHKDFSLGELTYLLSPNLEKHQELYLNLDLMSLKNLVDMCGGMTLTVPTKEELDKGFQAATDSFRFAFLGKKQDELNNLGPVNKTEPCKDSAFEFFHQWLKSNKSQLSPMQLDRLMKIMAR